MGNAAPSHAEDLPSTGARTAGEWARLGDDVARAAGIVAAQAGCSADRGLRLMRACVELTDRSLVEIAVAVIDRQLRFDRGRSAGRRFPARPMPDRGAFSLICPRGRVDQSGVKTDLRAVVECLLSAHYSEQEILDYLTGPIGVTDAAAIRALRECSGTGDLFGLGECRNPA